jgi:hypothetical protein
MSDEVRTVIGEALDGVRGDFSRAQARDAAWNAVMSLLERSEAEQAAPTVKVTVNLAGDTPEFRESLRKLICRYGGPGMSWAGR